MNKEEPRVRGSPVFAVFGWLGWASCDLYRGGRAGLDAALESPQQFRSATHIIASIAIPAAQSSAACATGAFGGVSPYRSRGLFVLQVQDVGRSHPEAKPLAALGSR